MPADTSRWRSSSSYDYIDDLGASDLAWECLRRNRDYQRDFVEIEQHPEDAGKLTEIARQRWRLHSPRQSKPQRNRIAGLLVAASRSWHRRPHGDATSLRI